jgi:hypothetical protein
MAPRRQDLEVDGSRVTDERAAVDEEPTILAPRWVVRTLWFGLVAVTAYVAGWIVAGAVREGYDPREQAISELFELGAPWGSQGWLVAGLALSGVAFLLLAPALHHALPGRGLLGPVLVVIAGIGTLGVLAAPCTPGCPGADTSTFDLWHAITAGGGYTALVLAPLAFAWRVRHAVPPLARVSWVVGAVGLVLFLAYVVGVVEAAPGLQQRIFNTVADGWYVLVAVWVLVAGGRENSDTVDQRRRPPP